MHLLHICWVFVNNGSRGRSKGGGKNEKPRGYRGISGSEKRVTWR